MTQDKRVVADRLTLDMENQLERHGILHRVYCGYIYTRRGEGYFQYQLNCYEGNTPPLMRTGGGRYRFKALGDKELRDIKELDSRGISESVRLREGLELFDRHQEWKERYKEYHLDCLFSR